MSAALIAFLVSIGAGGFGSMVGIGGGLVIVPVLSVALGYDVKIAIAASLIGVNNRFCANTLGLPWRDPNHERCDTATRPRSA